METAGWRRGGLNGEGPRRAAGQGLPTSRHHADAGSETALIPVALSDIVNSDQIARILVLWLRIPDKVMS